MEELINYLIRSSLSIAILVTAYKILFSNSANFNLNRIILITIVLFGFAGSIASALIFRHLLTGDNSISILMISDKIITVKLNELTISPQSIGKSFVSATLIYNLFYIIYFGGVLIMALRLIHNIIKIIRLYYISEKIKTDTCTIVLLNGNKSVFSFFNMLFISKELYTEPKASASIIKHEEIHITQYHSIDILLVELLKTIQWFNPFVYGLKKVIAENHEYLADRGTIATTQNISEYKILVLTHSIQQSTSMLTNKFSYLKIKKRIKMMEKQKSKIKAAVSLAAFITIISLVSFSCSNHEDSVSDKIKQEPEITQQELPKAPEVNKTEPLVSDTIFAVVEKMPEFPGGKKALMNYLKENIHYPEQAKKEGIHGRVIVNFIVEKDGSISGVKILRGIGHGCDEETVRVVRAMPKWIPGEQHGEKVRVSFNLPVKFVTD